jgi:hypothetical protein
MKRGKKIKSLVALLKKVEAGESVIMNRLPIFDDDILLSSTTIRNLDPVSLMNSVEKGYYFEIKQ